MRLNAPTLESLRESLLEETTFDTSFLVLTISSCIIATLGLLMNSSGVIIGAMIIAPLMLPLRGLALANLDTDVVLFKESLITLGLGSIVSIVISALIGLLFGLPAESFGSEILARTQPNLADLGVALTAGAISGYAKVRPKISDALAGTAIAVALMPPLCTVGIAFAQKSWLFGGGAFLLFLTNLLGITLACILVFIWGGYYRNPERMRQGLTFFLLMNLLLGIPLLISLMNLVSHARTEGLIRQLLARGTVTFGQKSELVDMKVDWNNIPWSAEPSKIILSVRTTPDRPIVTPYQIGLVEKLLEERLGRQFKIIVHVSQFIEVNSD